MSEPNLVNRSVYLKILKFYLMLPVFEFVVLPSGIGATWGLGKLLFSAVLVWPSKKITSIQNCTEGRTQDVSSQMPGSNTNEPLFRVLITEWLEYCFEHVNSCIQPLSQRNDEVNLAGP